MTSVHVQQHCVAVAGRALARSTVTTTSVTGADGTTSTTTTVTVGGRPTTTHS